MGTKSYKSPSSFCLRRKKKKVFTVKRQQKAQLIPSC